MNHSWILYLIITFVLSFGVIVGVMPLLLKLCKRKGIYDLPNERKVHHNKIPRLGGTLFTPAMLIGVSGAVVALNIFDQGIDIPVTLKTMLIVIGMFLLYLIGMLDDLFGLRASVKFMIQIVVSFFLPFCGLYIHNLYGLFGLYELPIWVAYPFTVFVSILIVNAINLIDGIDGLASSLSLIAIVLFGVLYYQHQIVFYTLYCTGLAGAIIAFLLYNLFGSVERSTKTFMGDTGSLTLGYAIAFLAISYFKSPTFIGFEASAHSPLPLIVPYTLVLVPCFDSIRVAIVRLLHHKPMFHPDKTHIHHKCLQAGFTMHQSLALILTLQLLFCAINAAFLYAEASATIIIATDVALFSLFIMWLNKRAARHQLQA